MKKLISLLLFPTSMLLFSCSGQSASSSGYDGREYDISVNGDGSLRAKSVASGVSYSLKISGQGKGKDYQSKNLVPWNPIAKRINKVEIESGITHIGDYYFNSINLDYVILPSTVTSIGEHSFGEGTKVFSYGAELENSPSYVYYYRESKPASKGNYFYMDGETPRIYTYTTPNLLFVGNSFTYRPGTEEDAYVPKYFKAIAANLGQETNIDYVVKGSHTLTKFANENDEMGAIVDSKLKTKKYDYIILQEQSTAPINSYNSYTTAVTALKRKIAATQNKDCTTILYETWGSPTAIAGSSYKTCGEMEAALREATEKCAKENECKVHYIGKAFTYAYETKKINVYAEDNRHQNDVGAYLSAAVHVRSLFGYNVRSCTEYCSLNAEEAKAILEIANAVI